MQLNLGEIEWSVPGSKKRSSPTPAAPRWTTDVEQARINRIADPSLLRGQTYFGWVSKLKRDPSFTTPWLHVRLAELQPKIAALTAQIWYEGKPPANLTSAELYKTWDKLDKLLGQQDAIRQVLQERARSGSGSAPTSTGTGSAPALAPDPFENE